MLGEGDFYDIKVLLDRWLVSSYLLCIHIDPRRGLSRLVVHEN